MDFQPSHPAHFHIIPHPVTFNDRKFIVWESWHLNRGMVLGFLLRSHETLLLREQEPLLLRGEWFLREGEAPLVEGQHYSSTMLCTVGHGISLGCEHALGSWGHSGIGPIYPNDAILLFGPPSFRIVFVSILVVPVTFLCVGIPNVILSPSLNGSRGANNPS